MHKISQRVISDYLIVGGGILYLVLSQWNLNFTIYLLPFIVGFLIKEYKTEKIDVTLNLLDFSVCGLLLIQLLISVLSSYKANSISHIIGLIQFFVYYLFLRYSVFTSKNKQDSFLISASAWFSILGLLTLFSFLLFQFNIEYEGFSDIINFRSLYNPLGQLSNDWVGFLIFFLTITTVVLLKTSHKYLKLGAFVTCIILGYCLVLSFSRGAYLSLICFFIFGLAGVLYQCKSKALGFVALIAVLVVLSIPFKKEAIETLGMVNTSSQQRSISGRSVLWQGALEMFADNPLQGVGQGNFLINRNAYLEKSPDSFYTERVTNSFLQLLAEQGILGAIAWGSVLIICLIFLVKGIFYEKVNSQSRILFTIILSGILAYGIREMTFSSFFQNSGLQLILAIILSFVSANSLPKNFEFSKKTNFISLYLILGITLLGGVIYLKNQLATKANSKFLEAYSEGDSISASRSISNAIKLQNSNALLFFNRSLISDTILAKYPIFSYDLNREEKKVILTCIDDLKEAERLSPLDAMIKHNLAVLYSAVNNKNKAQDKLDEALKIEPYEPLFATSKALFLKTIGNTEAANNQLLEAVKLSPEILESEVWMGFGISDSIIGRLIANNPDTLNPILTARTARIEMISGDLQRAKHLLDKVTTTLPNLNRPWLYRGQVALQEKDTSMFKTCLHRALLLDGTDMLVHYVLGNFHASIGDTTDAIYYYRQCLISYVNVSSPNYIQTRGYYQTKTIRNSVLPSKLLSMQKHHINAKNLCLTLAELYKGISKQKEAQLFNECYNGKKELTKVLEETSIKRL